MGKRVIRIVLRKKGNHADTAGTLSDAAGQPAATNAPASNPTSVIGSDGQSINLTGEGTNLAAKPLGTNASNRIIRVTLKKAAPDEKP